MFRHGLFVGKFYPPHLGHHFVIRAAASNCETVSVVVMASVVESIPIADRIAWLRAEHSADANVRVVGICCDAPVDVNDPTVWAAQVAAMRAALRSVTDAPVDAVYTGEDYGEELAARFEAKHVRLDRPPDGPSSTSVRSDLAAAWHTLSPATKAGLTTRVVVLGAESTGTTTVSRQLVASYRSRGGIWADTVWIGEYGRDYTETKWARERQIALAKERPLPSLDELVWTHDDFDQVAAEQPRRENEAVLDGSPLLICDTDAFATAMWERRYLGAIARCDQSWSRAPLLPRRDVYLLTDHHDVPWCDDGLREGDLVVRAAMTAWFADELTRDGCSWILLNGSLEQRISLARRAIDALLAHRHRMPSPLQGPGFERSA